MEWCNISRMSMPSAWKDWKSRRKPSNETHLQLAFQESTANPRDIRCSARSSCTSWHVKPKHFTVCDKSCLQNKVVYTVLTVQVSMSFRCAGPFVEGSFVVGCLGACRDNTPLQLSAPCRSGWLFHTAYQTSPLSLHIRPAQLSFCNRFGLEVWDESWEDRFQEDRLHALNNACIAWSSLPSWRVAKSNEGNTESLVIHRYAVFVGSMCSTLST